MQGFSIEYETNIPSTIIFTAVILILKSFISHTTVADSPNPFSDHGDFSELSEDQVVDSEFDLLRRPSQGR